MGAGHSMENAKETFTSKEYLLKSIEPLMGIRRNIARVPSGRRPLHPKFLPKDVYLDPRKRVSISGLVEEETLVGKYLLCRTLAPVFQLSAIVLIVDDPKGEQAVRLCIYEFYEDEKQMPELDEIFPVGTILAIQNPWFKMNLDGGYSVRVEGEGSIWIVSEKSFKSNFPRLTWKAGAGVSSGVLEKEKPKESSTSKIGKTQKTATDWKNEGNKNFVCRQYKEAYDSYSEGLKLEPNNVDILSNRSAAAIHLGCFHRGLEDSEKTLRLKSNHIKGIYRKAKSLAGLQRYEDALQFLMDKMSVLPEAMDTDDFKLLTVMLKRLEEERSTGNYNMPSIYSGGKLKRDDIADFQGPVKITNTLNKGRGLVATESIPSGTLVILCKAFGYVCEEEDDSDDDSDSDEENKFEEYLKKTKRNIYQTHMTLLVQDIMDKLAMEPEKGKQLLGLYAGEVFSDEKEKTSNMEKFVQAVCNYNCKAGDVVTFDSQVDGLLEKKENRKSLGLWLTPSYINHSCWDANCTQTTIGDIMIIRSCKDIVQGEEILMSYIHPTESYYHREQFCKILGFVCYCTLCQMERVISQDFRRERKLLFNKVKFCLSVPRLRTLIARVENLNRSQAADVSLKVTLLLALENMSHAHYQACQFENAAEAMIIAYNLVKQTSMARYAVWCGVNIVSHLLTAKKKKLAKKWRNILERDVAIAYGSDTKEIIKIVAKDTPVTADKEFFKVVNALHHIMMMH